MFRLPKYHDTFYDFSKPSEEKEVWELYKESDELRKQIKELRTKQLKISRRYEQLKRRKGLKCGWGKLAIPFDLKEYDDLENIIFKLKKQKLAKFRRIKNIKKLWRCRFDRFKEKTKEKSPAKMTGECKLVAFRQGVKRAPSPREKGNGSV